LELNMSRPVDLTNPIFTDLEAARAHFEAIRWPNGPYCPYCGVTGDRIAALGGKSMGAGWYHCKDCRRKFTAAVGTIYERSHIPLTKWFLATHLMCSSKKAMSAHQLGRMLGLPYKTAWFMAHRIREAMTESDPRPLGGNGKVVEADEVYIGKQPYEFTNDMGWHKKRSGSDKIKVLTMVERGGRARSIKIESLKAPEIRKHLVTNVWRDSELHTDEANHYRRVGREFAKHETVNHAIKEYARGSITTNTVEGFFSIFRRGMRGVYQHCGEQHLQRYLTEFDFRYSNRIALGVDDAERAARAVKGAEGKRLTYRRPRGIAANA
jgi:transposase-like protein